MLLAPLLIRTKQVAGYAPLAYILKANDRFEPEQSTEAPILDTVDNKEAWDELVVCYIP